MTLQEGNPFSIGEKVKSVHHQKLPATRKMFVRLFLAQITLAAFSSHYITLGTDQENPTEDLQTSQSIEAKQGRICKLFLTHCH